MVSADNKEPRSKTKNKEVEQKILIGELTRSGTVDQRRHQRVLWGIRDRHCWNVFYRDSRSFVDRRRGRNRARSSGNGRESDSRGWSNYQSR